MTACPDKEMALHALADGEIDALAAVALEEHLRTCSGCRAALDEIEQLRALLADPGLRHAAPAGLRDRIIAATDTASVIATRPTPAWGAWGGGGALGAIAASLLFLVAVPQINEPGLADQLVDSHIRSLQATHLTDVLTSNRHVVKPWFNGRINYSPPVVDLVAQGYPLIGGRLDVVDRQTVAVLVYGRLLHRINLFIRPAPALASPFAASERHDSYNLVRWTAGGLEYWAVSDVDAHDLDGFRTLFEQATKK